MQLIESDLYNEIILHIAKIKAEMKKEDLDSLLIAYNSNLYYTTGRFFRGYVYIPVQDDPLWFIIKPNSFNTSGKKIFQIRKPEDIPGILKESGYDAPKNLGFEENELSYSEIMRLRALFPGVIYKNASPVIKRARMVKTSWEINEMKIDGMKHSKVYSQISDCYKPGMTDLEFQIEIERRLRLEGSLGISRVAGNLMDINLGSVISGENADTPSPYEFTMGGAGMHPTNPVGANNETIKSGQTVMIDMNGAFNGYQTDMTRVWCLGQISDLALKAHNCSIHILRCLEENAKPGTPVKDMYAMAIRIVVEAGLQDFFMGHNSQVGFIGHGVGIELNELPVITPKSKDILDINMTLAIEPKFVIPSIGAVGVENTYFVSPTGLQNITLFPEEIQFL